MPLFLQISILRPLGNWGHQPISALLKMELTARDGAGTGVVSAWRLHAVFGFVGIKTLMGESCVLFVEDNPDDVFLIQRALRAAGLTNGVQVVTDGESAIEYLGGTGRFADRKAFPKAKLMLLDLNLPRKTGMEVLEWLSKQPREGRAKVIVLTGHKHPDEFWRAHELGASGFLLKPTGPEKWSELARMVMSWAEFNQFE
jgi:CheY-like chemotaxis protein